MFKPAQTCLGCCSLLVGVEVVCLNTIATCTLIIATCSSVRPVQVVGLVVSPEVQVFVASYAFIGIPLAVAAGVGVLHRIEQNVRAFFAYLIGSFFLFLAVPVWFLWTNDLCDVVVDPKLQEQGAAFVCGFTDTFIFTWTLLVAAIQAYVAYIVWSAAEDIRACPYPELLRYEDALRSAKLPPIDDSAAGPTPEMMARSAFGIPGPYQDMPRQPGGLGQRQPGPVSMALDAAAAAASGAPGAYGGRSRAEAFPYGSGAVPGPFDEGFPMASFQPAPPPPPRGAGGGSYPPGVGVTVY